MQKSMPIENRVAQTCIAHPAIQAFVVSAFGKPDAQGPFPKKPVVLSHGGSQLGTHHLWVLSQQRQIAVGCSAGEQIENALALERCKAWNQIAFPAVPGSEMVLEAAGQVLRCSSAVSGSLLQQVESCLDPGWETLPERGIRQ